MREGDFVLLLYDSTFSVEGLSEGFAVRYASFSYALVEEAIYKPLSDLFWQFVYARPVSHPSSRQQQLLDAWWCQLQWIAGINADVCRDESLRNALRTLLVAVDVELARFAPRMAAGSWGGSSWMLVTRFFKLLSQHCHEERNVRFYADRLSVTHTWLYKLCVRCVHLSPKEAIDHQTVTELKSYLANTDLPVKRIADEMHFEDVSYMCRYFKRMTGVSPEAFRKGL